MKTIYEQRFGETIIKFKLKSGMQVHILPKDDPYYTTYVELSMPYGALHLTYQYDHQIYQTPYGTAHFLEHQIFSMPEGDAFAKFSMLGTDANAMTSYNQTSYLFVATNHVDEALDHLLHMLDTPYFIESKVEAEKDIIAEELKMYLDDPMTLMQNELMEQMYAHHPIKHDIGGTLDSIQTIDHEVLLKTYQHFYSQNNRLLVIAGKVDVKKLAKYFRAYEKNHQISNVKPLLILPKEQVGLVKKHVVKKTDVSIDKLMLGIKMTPKKMGKKKRLIKEMALSMLLNMVLGNASRQYEALLEEQLINHSFYVSTNVEEGAEHVIIYSESKHVKKLKQRLLDILTHTLSHEVTIEAFDRYKKVYMGQFIYALNHLDTKAYLYGKYHHMQTSLYDVVDLLKEITYEDITSVIKDMKPSRISTLIYQKQ